MRSLSLAVVCLAECLGPTQSMIPGPGAGTPRAIVGDGWAVREVDLADGGARTLVDGMPFSGYVTAVAVDAQHRVYWLDNFTDALSRVDANGGNRETLYTSADPFSNPLGLAIDDTHGFVFWCETHSVMRARLDGSGAAVFLSLQANEHPSSIALDVTGGLLYWTDDGTDTVNRIAYDLSARQVLHSAGDAFSNPRGVALDVAAGKMFWAESFAIFTANLDGSGLTTVVPGVTQMTFPTGVAVDPDAQRLYWTDNGTDALARATYDGTGQAQVYASSFWSPIGPGDAGVGGNATNPSSVALIR